MSRLTPAEQDERDQLLVLEEALSAHPARLTSNELARQLAAGCQLEGERVGRAIRDLTGAGLLHREGDFISATRAAVRFHQLWSAGP